MHKRASIFSFVVCLLCACGGASATGAVHPSSPFTESDAKLFEDGVDFLADPDALQGQWAVDWETEMRSRIGLADTVAVVTVTTLRTDVDPQNRTTYRVVATVDRQWKGKVPSRDLSLSVPENAVGYVSVDRDKQRMLNTSFIAFIKWYETEDELVSAHWHLSVASERVLTRVRAHLEKQTPSKRTVIIEHTSKND
jgi:hypothetical protein